MGDSRLSQPVLEPVDFLIITALPEERDALLDILGSYNRIQLDGRPTYYLSAVPAYGRNGDYRVAVTMLSQMGNVHAAQHTSQAIKDLSPDHVLVVGIAGGVKGKVGLGDVIVATNVLYYEQAKQCGHVSKRSLYIVTVEG